jgi:hypothetical protein
MDYHVEEMRPIHVPHEKGKIMLEVQGEKTKVVLISDSRLSLPIFGPLLARLIQRRVSRAFLGVLKYIERH